MNIDLLFKNPDKMDSTNLSLLDISKELEILKQDTTNEINRLKFIFTIEVLNKIIKKPNDYRIFVDILISVLDKCTDSSFIIFKLRILKNLSIGKYFVPIYFYLFDLINQTINTSDASETQNYDFLNIKKVDIEFVLGEIRYLILSLANKYSTEYAFVEIANMLINELKRISKGIYKEYCDNIINVFIKHRDYVIKCRTENIPCEKMIK